MIRRKYASATWQNCLMRTDLVEIFTKKLPPSTTQLLTGICSVVQGRQPRSSTKKAVNQALANIIQAPRRAGQSAQTPPAGSFSGKFPYIVIYREGSSGSIQVIALAPHQPQAREHTGGRGSNPSSPLPLQPPAWYPLYCHQDKSKLRTGSAPGEC